MEYYSAIKINDIMRFAGKWIEQLNSILSEVSQSQKDKFDMFTYTWIAVKSMFNKRKKEMIMVNQTF